MFPSPSSFNSVRGRLIPAPAIQVTTGKHQSIARIRAGEQEEDPPSMFPSPSSFNSVRGRLIPAPAIQVTTGKHQSIARIRAGEQEEDQIRFESHKSHLSSANFLRSSMFPSQSSLNSVRGRLIPAPAIQVTTGKHLSKPGNKKRTKSGSNRTNRTFGSDLWQKYPSHNFGYAYGVVHRCPKTPAKSDLISSP
ncbi:unnamed protein product [Cuscuta europaea]|uniref:Uncharacterized protein n=1 Tax=Cuscuta europaea TaxID=41803 RepID=A0A9P1E762_CUSEU|nr:unnamed protein product [Cuscuta europaea]